MLRPPTFAGFLAAFLLVAAFALPPVDVRLALNLQEGDVFTVRMTTDQRIQQVLMGQEQDVEQTIGLTYTMRVEEAEADSYTVAVTYSGVRFRQVTPAGTVDFDSESGAAPPLPAAGYAALVGQGFTARMDHEGHVGAVEGVGAMLDAMIAQIAPEALPEQRAVLVESLQQQFGDDAMRTQVENMMAIYPEGPVAVGATWTKNTSVSAGMAVDVENVYRLDRLEAGMAHISVRGELQPAEGDPVLVNGMSIAYALSGTQTGELAVDVGSGWTQKAVFEQNLSGEVTMNGEMTWPMTIASTITVETLQAR